MEEAHIRPTDLAENHARAYAQDVDRYRSVQAQFIERNCPACLSASSEKWQEKDGFTYRRCHACWAVFMSPGPTAELVKWFYEGSKNYAFWAEEMYPMSRMARMESLHRPRAEWSVESMDRLSDHSWSSSSPLRILEVGAGTGDTLRALNERAPRWTLMGLEPNPSMRPFWGDRPSLIEDYESLQSISEGFNAVLAFEVIEHLLNPREFLGYAHDLLRPAGLLFVSTPNSLSIEIQGLKGESKAVDVEHISLLTPAAMVQLASDFNYDIVSIETPGELDIELILQSSWCKQNFGEALDLSELTQDFLDGLQNMVRESGMSSHMRVILRRR